MTIRTFAFAAAVAFTACATGANATIINFDDQGLTGPCCAASTSAGPLSITAGGDTVDFTNGAILTNEASLPADTTSVYYNSFFLPGTSGSSMTITFSNPINNFFLNLYNGWVTPDTFTVSDNAGRSKTVTIDSNSNGGLSLISFPAVGNIITITTSNLSYDYSIDNIGFNEATPGVPEPAAWALMLVGFAGLGAALRQRRALSAA
ncbi:MAG TPA: PEPxxWA-CTERM sorting domain-containing protein [Phenylobacterium sp.]|jgi:hypothetical protein